MTHHNLPYWFDPDCDFAQSERYEDHNRHFEGIEYYQNIHAFKPPLWPRYVTVLETDQYFGYLELRLRDPQITADRIRELAQGLQELTGNLLTAIKEIPRSGPVKMLYQIAGGTPLPELGPQPTFLRTKINFRDWVSLVTPAASGFDEMSQVNQLMRFLADFYTDSRAFDVKFWNGPAIKNGFHENGSHAHSKNGQSKSTHSFVRAHQNGQAEQHQLVEALDAHNIHFQKQVEFYQNGSPQAVVNVLIEQPPIAIFLDYDELHVSQQGYQRDRRQDREFQRMGYTVLRFTRSEIQHQLPQCVQEIEQFIHS